MKIALLIISLAIGEISAARPRRSIGGWPKSIEDAPYFVSITHFERHICGGVLITLNHVLTAAGYVSALATDHSKVRVVTGRDQRGTGGTSHKIRKIRPHPQYAYALEMTDRQNDIAVITLLKRIQVSDTQKPIEWPDEKPEYWKNASLIAFESKSPRPNDHLHELQIVITPIDSCAMDEPNPYASRSTIFCAKNYKRHGMYLDDAGSPVVRDGKLVGIASVYDRIRRNFDVFTKVYTYLDFIQSKTKCRNSLCVIT